MALQKVKGNIEYMFDKNLKDLIRGIRNNKNNEAKYIAHCIEEIKQELRQENIAIKANAVAKLTYLQMLGYNISWAAFNIIEVMSSSKFTYKRIGYLSSSQSFHADIELLMLTTNMIRKDLSSHNQYESGLALSGLSCFVSPDLAKDLVTDIMILLTSTKPYLRKKAVLMMYKVLLRFPEALRPAFPRLKEKLEDSDSGVQSAAVNVVCELACKNPRNYLSLAPILFRLMTTSTNNWMLIKIIKLFGALTPLEPRLGKKLIEPLTNLIHSTSAMSLLYECINTVIAVLISISSEIPNHTASLQLCIQKLRILIEDSDQNLKYLGLLAISKILKTHPKTVQAHKDLIMQCLDDKDESIRLRALDLIYGIVSKKNLMEIVKKLMSHVEKAEGNSYRSRFIFKIIQICSQDNYQYIINFEWYVSVLVELSHMEGNEHGLLVASQILDVAVRVQAVRQFAVQQMALLIDNASFLTAQSSSITHVLYAAAWITGEFSEYLINPQSTLEAMLRGQVFHLPGHIKAVYIQNILKLLVNILTKVEKEHDIDRITKLCETVAENLSQFVLNADLEVQERASSALQLVKYLQKEVNRGKFGLAAEMAALFVGELNPVAPKAQKKVQIPEGLDLNVWINEPPPESLEKEMPFSSADGGSTILFHKYNSLDDQTYNFNKRTKKLELSEEELEKRRQTRKREKENNPHYLKEHGDHKTSRNSSVTNNCVGVPVVEIELPISLKIPGLASSENYLNLDWSDKKQEKKKNRRRKGIKNKVQMVEEEDHVAPLYMVNRDIGEMPEGAQVSDGEESDSHPADEPHKSLVINVDEALHDNEKLLVLTDLTLESPLASLKTSGNKRKKCHHYKAKLYSKDKEKCKSMLIESQSNKSRKESAENIDLGFGKNCSDYSVIPNLSQKQTCVANVAEQNISRKSKKMKENKKKKTKGNKEKELEENGNKKEKKSKENKEKKTKHLKYKEGYEEATGISVLSKEIIEDSLQSNSEINEFNEMVQSPSSSYVTLAKDENLQLVHKIRLSPDESNNIVVTIKLTNQTSSLIKGLEFNICNTPVVSLLKADKDSRDCIKLQFQLPAQSCNEAKFVFQVIDVTFPHKVRGNVTYMVQTSNESHCQEKLDFWFNFPCSTFTIGRLPYHDTLSDLFSSGQLTNHKSMLLEVSKEFSQILAQLCSHCHFLLVEQVGKTASLYSRSIQNHHICLLIKSTNDSGDSKISFEGKSNCDTILMNIFSEIEMLLYPLVA